MSKIKFPNTKGMLPSQEHAAVTEFFLERMLAAKVNYLGECTYRLQNALEESSHVKDTYTRSIIDRCFWAAADKYKALKGGSK